MTAAEVNLVISYSMMGSKMQRYDYVSINGTQVRPADVRRIAKEGDEIYWESYRDYRTIYVTRERLATAVAYKAQRAKTKAAFGRVRDSQRSALYQWEREIVKRGTLPKVARPKSLIAEVFAAYGLDALTPHVVISHKRTRSSCYQSLYHRITLAAGWGTDLEVVLHEAAHALLQVGYGTFTSGHYRAVPIEAHGPEFAALLLELYEMYLPDGTFDPANAKTRIRIDRTFCLATHVRKQRATCDLYVRHATGIYPS